MQLTVRIPDEVAERLIAYGSDIERVTLEALVLEAFRSGQISKADLRRALGFQVLNEVDGFLKTHGVVEDYPIEEVQREVETLERLGI